MPRAHRLLNENRLWRLITVRWSAQLTDGLYQSALASYVLFSPERQASATAAVDTVNASVRLIPATQEVIGLAICFVQL